MKLIVVLCLFGFALGLPPLHQPDAINYHENIGIPQAALIKAAEESTDFDGSRIVGGGNANLGQYPWMAGLLVTLADGRISVCGSTLISNNRIVTAAHCWTDGWNRARQFQVVLGSLTIFSGGVRINTNNVAVHPQYRFNTLMNDIAVGVISWVGFNNNIRNLPLASGNNLFVGAWGNVAGFGRQRDGAGIPNYQRLHHVRVQVISNFECERHFGVLVLRSNICTSGAGGRNPCGGDSGGPLEVARTLAGIVSFGSNAGCQRGIPSAYARVTHFNSWIRSRM